MGFTEEGSRLIRTGIVLCLTGVEAYFQFVFLLHSLTPVLHKGGHEIAGFSCLLFLIHGLRLPAAEHLEAMGCKREDDQRLLHNDTRIVV